MRHLLGDVRQRLRRLDPSPRRAARNAPVRVDTLIILVGLKRSGLHAVANWLLGMDAAGRLVNNSPMKRLGLSSPMSRTRGDSPLPIYLYAGSPVLALDDNGDESVVTLRDRESLIVVIFQSQNLARLARHKLLLGVEAARTLTLLQLRDPFNWSASYKAKSRETSDNRQWPPLWREYALEYTGRSHYLPGAVRVNYNRWLSEQVYRQDLARQIGLQFADKHLGAVSSHAGGSSFDNTRYDGDARAMRLTSRWQCFQHDPDYLACLRANRDLVALGLDLFELPPDLRRFGRELVGTNDS